MDVQKKNITKMKRLVIFANFFIDNEERFLRMQDSFISFKDVNADKWVINVRGRFAEQTVFFLKNKLGEKLVSFQLHSNDGWFYDTRQMLHAIDCDFVLFWIEDHICMCGPAKLDQIVHEMGLYDIDQLIYSWWHNGNWLARYEGVSKKIGTCIDYFEHDDKSNLRIQENGVAYLISAAGIFSRKLFQKIILTDDPNPKRWPKETPFDFEKEAADVHWLPFRVALPKDELFASIDDDHGVKGYCLQSRGLYPIRTKRMSYAIDARLGWGGYLKNKLRPFIPDSFVGLYLNLCDNLKFYYVQRIKGFDVPTEPYFDPVSLPFFIEKLKSSKQYLEYGSGGSTVYAATLAKNFTTVDSDKFFLRDVQKKISSAGLSGRGSQKYIHADIGLTKAWGTPLFSYKNKGRLAKWENYSGIPWQGEVDFLPDLILIDGRFRIACALKTIKYLYRKNAWLMLVDDYVGRDQYKAIEQFATLDKLVGRMAVFKEMPNIDLKELNLAINKYEFEFD